MIQNDNQPPFIVLGLVTGMMLMFSGGCQTARPNATAGGLFGTAAGGVLGAAIGAHEGKSGEGALIGGLAGGTIGALMGDQADQANFRDERAVNAQQQAALAEAITMDQIVQMTRSGLSDDLITNQIDLKGIVSPPTTNDLILLKQNGVSDRVISSLQSAAVASNRVGRSQGRTVVVQPTAVYAEPWCPGPPVFYQPPPAHYRHYHPRHHHGGSGVGFSMGF